MRCLDAVPALLALALTGSAPDAGPGPRYTPDGALARPPGVERWIVVGTSLGLGYTETTGSAGRMFHQIHLAPEAYDAVRRTGRFPAGTMFALVAAPPAERTAPARRGLVADTPVGLELAVKDPARFPGGWAYFDFGDGASVAAARPLPRERCERCHAEHGARDHVFTQFYPLLRQGVSPAR
jgi:hypothetical protein